MFCVCVLVGAGIKTCAGLVASTTPSVTTSSAPIESKSHHIWSSSEDVSVGVVMVNFVVSWCFTETLSELQEPEHF